MLMMVYCRQVPPSEMVEIARYLANLFSCNIESLPTELLVHWYWTSMPHQFANARNYSRCLKAHLQTHVARTCHHVNRSMPHQFANARSYRLCLKAHLQTHMARTCHHVNRSMPHQFANASSYSRCQKAHLQSHLARSCHYVNPYYCGRRFGEQAGVDRLTACRQLMSGSDAPNYTVPQRIGVRIRRYRACLSRSRSVVGIDSSYMWHLEIQ